MIIKHPQKASLSAVQEAMDVAQKVLKIPDGAQVSFTIYANFYDAEGKPIEFIQDNGRPLEGIQIQ